jgi:hypothetical protein
LLFGIFATLTLAACGGGQATPAPPSGPAQKLQAAAAAMRQVETFRFTADVVSGTQQVHLNGEFSAPDSLHETVKVGTGTLEFVRIGARTYRRDSPTAKWAAVPAASTTTPTDPRSAFAVLSKATDVHLVGAGYGFGLGKTAAASLVKGSAQVTGTAQLAGGRITDLSYATTNPVVTVHLTYADFNATPRVTAPLGL